MLDELILKNEKIIENFNKHYYIENKHYSIAAALSALEATNKIQKCYFGYDESFDEAENILRLYALLQSLFVSIDSLYALAFALTKSKSFININKNDELRELKYIRNDIVGHPANRVLDFETLAYCILDTKSIKKMSFKYHIYYGDNVEEKEVDVKKIVVAYYNECNNLLDELTNVAENVLKASNFTKAILRIIDSYYMKGNYQEDLKEFRKAYLEIYPNATASQHRVLWRLDLIDALLNFKEDNVDILELTNHAIGIELIKIYQLITGEKYEVNSARRNPQMVSAFYRFLNKNKSLIPFAECLTDSKNPHFMSSLILLLEVAKEKHAVLVIDYLHLLMRLYQTKNNDLLYALALPIKEYKKKN